MAHAPLMWGSLSAQEAAQTFALLAIADRLDAPLAVFEQQP